MRAQLSLCLALLAGCDAATASPEGRPEDAVRRTYAALAKRDCTALLAALGGTAYRTIEQAGCERAFHEHAELGITLRSIDRVDRDARDRTAFLVTLTLDSFAKQRRVVNRVANEHGRWVVTVR